MGILLSAFGSKTDAAKLNPWPRPEPGARPAAPKSPETLAAESRRAWALLDLMFAGSPRKSAKAGKKRG